MFALDGSMCLDYVSRPDAFASLYGKLLDGYLLDAVERLDGKQARRADVEDLVVRIEAARRSWRRSPSLGNDLRLRGGGVVGSGLALDGELIQLCAFTTAGEPERTLLAPPSRRR